MYRNNIIDDSKSVISHYKKILPVPDSKLLNKIIVTMNAWSNFVKTQTLNNKDKEIFIDALQSKNEYLWFELGIRLSKLIPNNSEIQEMFLNVFNSTKIQARFNIVALSKDFPKTFAENILLKAIKDKSNKVRMKVADIILTRQEKDLLPILKKHLEQEDNKMVIDSINFTIDNFHKMTRNSDGSLSLSIG